MRALIFLAVLAAVIVVVAIILLAAEAKKKKPVALQRGELSMNHLHMARALDRILNDDMVVLSEEREREVTKLVTDYYGREDRKR